MNNFDFVQELGDRKELSAQFCRSQVQVEEWCGWALSWGQLLGQLSRQLPFLSYLFAPHQGFEVLSHILEGFGLVFRCVLKDGRDRRPKRTLASWKYPQVCVPAWSVRHEGHEGLSPPRGAQGVPTRQTLLLAAGSLSERDMALVTSLPGSCFQTVGVMKWSV